MAFLVHLINVCIYVFTTVYWLNRHALYNRTMYISAIKRSARLRAKYFEQD